MAEGRQWSSVRTEQYAVNILSSTRVTSGPLPGHRTWGVT